MNTTPGLQSIQATLLLLQRELATLKNTNSLSSIADDIFSIRAKHIQNKIKALNDEFVCTLGEETASMVTQVVKAMEFVEENALKYAQLLDVSTTGPFKQELVLLLMKDTLGMEINQSEVSEIIEYMSKATAGLLKINQHKVQSTISESIELTPENSQLVPVKNKNERKLRKFVFGRKSKH